MKQIKHESTIVADRNPDAARQPWRYFVSLLVCIFFYFGVAIFTLPYMQRLLPVSDGTSHVEIFQQLFPVFWRTLVAYTGILLSLRFILRMSIAPLFRHFRINMPAFFAVFVVFSLLLLFYDLTLAAATDSSITFNTRAWKGQSVTTLLFLLAGLLLIPLHALTEEIIYRAIPLQGLSFVLKKMWPAIAISSLLFWLNHGGMQPLYWLPVGVVLGLIVVRTKTIIHTWAIHTAFNFYNAEIINTVKGTEYTPAMLLRHASVSGDVQLLGSLICLVLMLFLFVKTKFFKSSLYTD